MEDTFLPSLDFSVISRSHVCSWLKLFPSLSYPAGHAWIPHEFHLFLTIFFLFPGHFRFCFWVFWVSLFTSVCWIQGFSPFIRQEMWWSTEQLKQVSQGQLWKTTDISFWPLSSSFHMSVVRECPPLGGADKGHLPIRRGCWLGFTGKVCTGQCPEFGEFVGRSVGLLDSLPPAPHLHTPTGG